MKRKVRLGLILVGALSAIVWKMPHTQEVRMPDDLVIKARHATWEQKKKAKEVGKAYASAGWGWTGREWLCLHDLWMKESRWDYLAQNPRSSAFGIAQRLGEDSRNYRIQILRGLRYIETRYGSPCRAKAFHDRRNHY